MIVTAIDLSHGLEGILRMILLQCLLQELLILMII